MGRWHQNRQQIDSIRYFRLFYSLNGTKAKLKEGIIVITLHSVFIRISMNFSTANLCHHPTNAKLLLILATFFFQLFKSFQSFFFCQKKIFNEQFFMQITLIHAIQMCGHITSIMLWYSHLICWWKSGQRNTFANHKRCQFQFKYHNWSGKKGKQRMCITKLLISFHFPVRFFFSLCFDKETLWLGFCWMPQRKSAFY